MGIRGDYGYGDGSGWWIGTMEEAERYINEGSSPGEDDPAWDEPGGKTHIPGVLYDPETNILHIGNY